MTSRESNVHLEYKGHEVWNQNEDGSPHHPDKLEIKDPPKKVKKKLKEKTGWDVDGNKEKQKDDNKNNTDDQKLEFNVDEETVKKASTVTTMTVVVVIIVEIALTIITGTPVDLPN